MTATPPNTNIKNLSVYSLPPLLLENLTVRSIQAEPSQPIASSSRQPAPAPAPAATATGSSRPQAGIFSCQSCPDANFDSLQAQRDHFQSDWHRYNMKARQTGGKAVNGDEFDQLVGGVSSISGSDSASGSSSDSSDGEEDKVSKLLRRQKLQDEAAESDDEALELADRQRRAQLRTAVIWFAPREAIDSLGIPKDTQFGVHRALFPQLDNAAQYLEELRRMQLPPSRGKGKQTTNGDDDGGHGDDERERRVTLLMVAGGHFAGMVVGIRPRSKGEKQDVKGAGELRILQHKTFHRYTTRKKQGGSQALNDNSKSKAISAGAMLRRYGEQALQEEIRALMREWQDDLEASEKIFIRASTHGKKSFWGYEGAVLEKGDPRVRVFPFQTRRPTQSELLRCWYELIRVKVSHLSEETLRAQDEAYIASLQPRRPIIKQAPTPQAAPAAPIPKKDPEQVAREQRYDRLIDMIQKGRLDPLRPFWEKNRAEFTSSADILAAAAQAGQEEVLRFFLEDQRLDPTLPLDGPDGSKRAYDVCGTKGARNVFRRVAHAHPDWCDWKAAHVPSGLSEEMEVAQDAKKAERRKGLREKMKEREKARAEADGTNGNLEEVEPAPAPAVESFQRPNGSGGPVQKLGGRDAQGLAGMTPEMRMAIERERRARAAEARFK